MIGPHWYFSLIAVIFIASLSSLMVYTTLSSKKYKEVILILSITAIQLAVFSLNVLSDPGILINQNHELLSKDEVYCSKCNNSFSDNVVHCQDCDVCVL